ncbi:MAG: DUF2007 domain-containing protein [Armatimonadetes bacterium]|nr:DUF2007 domain-containing protein [Armatimonadota bacterium]
MPKDDWITVERAPIAATAQMMRSRLEIEGIDAVLRGNHAAGTAGAINELNLSWDNPLGGVEVRVRSEDAARAREILAARDDEPAPRRRAPLWIQIAAALLVAQTAFVAGAGISGEAVWGGGAALVAFGAILALGRRRP